MKKQYPKIKSGIQKIAALAVLAVLFLGVAHVWATGTYAVRWGVGIFDSDVYNIEDLTFVWDGDIGSATDTEVTGCGTGNCFFDTTYDQTGIREVSVYAKNAQGQQVSNVAVCQADVQQECPCANGYVCVNNRCVYGMEVSCGGYATPTAQNPTIFFNPGTTVYWKPTITGGTQPYRYSWTIQTESGTVRNTQQTSGPFYIASVGQTIGDYLTGETYTAELAVRDANNGLVNASCTIATKQCQFNADCATLGYPSNYYCNQSTFTCVPPDPIFVKTLGLNKGVVNKGNQCTLSWEVSDATTCTVYRNNVAFPQSAATSTTNFTVDPGTYTISCVNAVGTAVNAGPVQCIYNPEIRES